VYFVTGGAFQGKRKWVTQLIQETTSPFLWVNGYEQHVDVSEVFNGDTDIIIIEGIEELIRQSLHTDGIQPREQWRDTLLKWVKWEIEKEHRQLIIIGCEVGLGVVPMEKNARIYRDIVGWVYQDIASSSQHVVRIWCGLAEILKEEKG
jgi:adenosylcobinamide kinase/adenosylcobinamide-phosphate guanylyltransferase